MAENNITSAASMKSKSDRWAVVSDEVVSAWAARLMYRIDLVAVTGRCVVTTPWIDSTMLEPNDATKAAIKQLFVDAGYEWDENDQWISWENAA